MNLGYINYLNCFPFYYHMFEKDPLPGVRVVPAIPGDLNLMMADGSLDMSPMSAGAYPDMQEKLVVLPDFCLSSIGYVRSVVLQSRVPIEELDGKRVGLTSASKTSVVLLKILLEKYYGLRPAYSTVPPRPSFENIDAALIIGNDAMLEPDEPIEYIYDLGDLWMRKTGHPVVFAIFAVRIKALPGSSEQVRRIIRSYNHSVAYLRDYEDEVVARAAERYPEMRIDIAQYYRLLKFHFTPQLKKALQFYYDEGAALGLFDPVKKIEFAEI
ncbi:MAG TPA: menaquinone biosynthesis protein [Spirochaetota bacterium]|nr:menaquinone biosynthesis protein [Spirochaetota bacterium]HPI91036.1 menaquinone biosynthesis protein [Spirochaetota bacterium]HPR47299.1 menaquinone biosynthesis protein [Spirochaetota bacterium]